MGPREIDPRVKRTPKFPDQDYKWLESFIGPPVFTLFGREKNDHKSTTRSRESRLPARSAYAAAEAAEAAPEPYPQLCPIFDENR